MTTITFFMMIFLAQSYRFLYVLFQGHVHFDEIISLDISHTYVVDGENLPG